VAAVPIASQTRIKNMWVDNIKMDLGGIGWDDMD
jgi:hypothetical protein